MAITYSSTWVQICNAAIARIGKPAIASLDDGSVVAGYCNTYLGEVIETCAGEDDWNALASRAQLARLSTTPAFGWDYEYQLPADILHPIHIYIDADTPAAEGSYSIEGDKLLTDGEEVFVVYVARPGDPAKLPAYFRRLISAQLAMRLTTPLTSGEALVARLATEANNAMITARREDARRAPAWTLENERGYERYEDLR